MKIHKCTQGDAEWHMLHVGRVTASEMDALMTPEFKIRTGETPKTYLYRKLAEGYRGKPLPGFYSWQTEQGIELEAEARRTYCFTQEDYGLRNVGFCEHEDGRSGCSPDALIGDEGGLEIKAPEPTNHVRYLIDGVLPKDYVMQVHFSMYVTGRPWWKFASYHRGYPMFILRVERNEEACKTIAEALSGFYAKYDAAMTKLRNTK